MSYFDFYRREFRSSVPENGVVTLPPKVYVVNTSSNDVSVIDTATDTVVKTISVSATPSELVITPDGKKVYVLLSSTSKTEVIDTATDTVIKTISSVGSVPLQMAVTPDSARVYLSNLFSGNVDVIDTVTDTILTTISVSSTGGRLAVMPNGDKVYFIAGGKINVIDNTLSPPVLITGAGFPITVGSSPGRLEITSDDARVYVSNSGSSNVSVISTSTDTVIATLSVGSSPEDLAILPDDSKVYVGNNTGATSTLQVIDNTQTPPVVDPTISSFTVPQALQATANGARVYLTDSPAKVKIVDTATDTQLGTVITLAGTGDDLKITRDSNKVYVSVSASDLVTVIDNTTIPAIKTTIAVGTSPKALAIQP